MAINSPLSPDNTLTLLQAGQARNSAATPKPTASQQEAETAASEFEAMFLSEMLKPMFESIGTNPMFGGGQGEEMFRSFLHQEYAKLMSQAGGIGIAREVQAELVKIQEQTQGEKI